MAGNVLYGTAPCFGHTGVTFDDENYRPGLGSIRGHFEAARGGFLRLKALLVAKRPAALRRSYIDAKRLVLYILYIYIIYTVHI